jgi:hypothetical protein
MNKSDSTKISVYVQIRPHSQNIQKIALDWQVADQIEAYFQVHSQSTNREKCFRFIARAFTN